MARILDFYAVRWEYEPHTFPILWNLDGEVVESFAPDFYLPELDLYLEMTTLRQRLVRKKNRKLRRLRELYPDLNVKLFYARDFRALMLKYGSSRSTTGCPARPGRWPLPHGNARRRVRVDAPRAAPIADSAGAVTAAGVPPPAGRRRRRPARRPTVDADEAIV